MNIRRKLFPFLYLWPIWVILGIVGVILGAGLWPLILIGGFILLFLTAILGPDGPASLLAIRIFPSIFARLGKLSPEVETVLDFLLNNEEFMAGGEASEIQVSRHKQWNDDYETNHVSVKNVEVPLTKCEEALLGRIMAIRSKNLSRSKRKSAIETSSAAIDALMHSQEIALTTRLEALRAQIEQKDLDSSPRSPTLAPTKETPCTRSTSSAAQ